MSKIPTAAEFLRSKGSTRMICMEEYYTKVSPQTLIEFTKLHVQAALKEAVNQAEIRPKASRSPLEDFDKWCEIDDNSITNSYPLTNIK